MPPAAAAPAPAAAEAAPPAWEQSARELLAAVRGKGLPRNPVGVDQKLGPNAAPRVHGSSYFCFEAPGHYPCVYDIIGERYKDSKTATAKSSMRMRSHPQLIMYLEGALARGASVRLESAWDWAAHTGSRSGSRSPAQLEPTTAPSSPPRTPPPKRAQTAVPATVCDWCAARGRAPNSTRYRDADVLRRRLADANSGNTPTGRGARGLVDTRTVDARAGDQSAQAALAG